MTLFDKTPYRGPPDLLVDEPGPAGAGAAAAWVGAMSDPSWRRKYADAIEAQIARWDVAQLQGWLDSWSQQIADAVASDPHAAATPAQFQMAVAAARETVARRRDFLQGFVDCVKGGAGQNRTETAFAGARTAATTIRPCAMPAIPVASRSMRGFAREELQ